MKTMADQDNSTVLKVSDEEAEILEHEGFHYVPKSVWKEYQKNKTGDIGISLQDKYGLMNNKSNKMSKSAKRHLRKQNKNG